MSSQPPLAMIPRHEQPPAFTATLPVSQGWLLIAGSTVLPIIPVPRKQTNCFAPQEKMS